MSQDDPLIANYMGSISDARALLVDPDEWLAGNTLLSAETVGGAEELATFIKNNFATFLKYVALLRPDDRLLLLSYHLLGKPQHLVGKVIGETQTLVSARQIKATRLLAFYALAGGVPSDDCLRSYLEADVACWIIRFRQVRNLKMVATEFKIHRPEMKRQIIRASVELCTSSDPLRAGLGEYLASLSEGQNGDWTGLSRVRRKRATRMIRRDPDTLGEFRVNVADMDGWFSSRAAAAEE